MAATELRIEREAGGRQSLRPPRSLSVVRDPDPAEIDARVDWPRWYLTEEEDTGEGCEQALVIEMLVSVLRELARERGWDRLLVSTNQFFAWIHKEPLVRVSPDVYLLDDPPDPLPASWQTWLSGHRPPRFAVEVVSPSRPRKDDDDAPEKYAQLGTGELIVFDPEAARDEAGPDRVAITVFRREEDGGFVRVHAGAGPAWSAELQAWLVSRAAGSISELRVARDPRGTDLVPSAAEARDQAERARAEERRHREAAEAELAKLRDEIAKLRGRE